MANQDTKEMVKAIQSLEAKLAPMVASMETVSNALTGKTNTFYDRFQKTMVSSLGENDASRRNDEAALKQHEEVRAANKSASGPDRNDPDYYD